MKLYEIPQAFAKIEEELADCDGQIPDDIGNKLDQLNAILEDKVAAIAAIIKDTDAELSGIKTEMSRLARMAAVRSNKIVFLKDYLKKCLEQIGVTKVTKGVHGCRIQANSTPSVTLTVPAEKLPAEFQINFVSPNNQAMIAAWKETGTSPEGVEIKVGSHLRIL